MKLSVVTCTHNPRLDYLTRVLDALKAQTLPREVWELLLIDNASDAPLADQVDLSWHPNVGQLREDRIGKVHALFAAMMIARGDIIVTVDDDNVLSPTYLSSGVEIGRSHPHLGVWGGSCLGEFEAAPPSCILKYLNRLAVTAISHARWSNSYSDFESIPPGAGMFFRRVVAEEYRRNFLKSQLRQKLGPTGNALLRCDDTDLAWTAIDCGLSCGRFPELSLTHLIPSERVHPDYMLRLIEGDACSRVLLERGRSHTAPIFGNARYSVARSMWLRLRMADFDYRAWKATQRGIQLGLETIARM